MSNYRRTADKDWLGIMSAENKKLNILIVEDNDADFRLVQEYLKEIGSSSFELLRVQKLAHALTAMAEFKFDAALLDLDLPDSQGLSTVKEIERHAQDLPLIVLTGLDDKKLGIESLKNGAQDYLVKGSARGELLEKSIHYAIERKRSEVDVRKTNLRLVAVLESLSDAFISWDRNWRYTYFNVAAERMLGYRRDELLGKDVRETFAGEKEVFLEKFKKAMEEHIPVNFEEYYEPWSTWVEVRAFQSWEGMSVFFRDITGRKKFEEIQKRDKETLEKLVQERTKELINSQIEIERAKRLSDIGILASTVAHELRNPLAAISMAAANIKRKGKNSDLEKHLETINKKVTESDQIINNLLFYSRLKSPHYESVNLFNIIKESVKHAKTRCEQKVNILDKIKPLKDIFIEADSLQMMEVFNNILNNACDAVSPEKGEIMIDGALENGLIKISISDNGSGIKKEHLSRVFDPFFTTKAKGTGLGLSVCQQIINLHEGIINLDSEEGKGTRIKIMLPKDRLAKISS